MLTKPKELQSLTLMKRIQSRYVIIGAQWFLKQKLWKKTKHLFENEIGEKLEGSESQDKKTVNTNANEKKPSYFIRELLLVTYEIRIRNIKVIVQVSFYFVICQNASSMSIYCTK